MNIPVTAYSIIEKTKKLNMKKGKRGVKISD
jgi:hypothetical protein